MGRKPLPNCNILMKHLNRAFYHDQNEWGNIGKFRDQSGVLNKLCRDSGIDIEAPILHVNAGYAFHYGGFGVIFRFREKTSSKYRTFKIAHCGQLGSPTTEIWRTMKKRMTIINAGIIGANLNDHAIEYIKFIHHAVSFSGTTDGYIAHAYEFEYAEGIPLNDILQDTDQLGKPEFTDYLYELLVEFRTIVHRIEESGIKIPDMNWKNIVVREPSSRNTWPMMTLIDLDSVWVPGLAKEGMKSVTTGTRNYRHPCFDIGAAFCPPSDTLLPTNHMLYFQYWQIYLALRCAICIPVTWARTVEESKYCDAYSWPLSGSWIYESIDDDSPIDELIEASRDNLKTELIKFRRWCQHPDVDTLVEYPSWINLGYDIPRDLQEATTVKESKTVKELKDELRALGLPVSGSKAVLIERLSANPVVDSPITQPYGDSWPRPEIQAVGALSPVVLPPPSVQWGRPPVQSIYEDEEEPATIQVPLPPAPPILASVYAAPIHSQKKKLALPGRLLPYVVLAVVAFWGYTIIQQIFFEIGPDNLPRESPYLYTMGGVLLLFLIQWWRGLSVVKKVNGNILPKYKWNYYLDSLQLPLILVVFALSIIRSSESVLQWKGVSNYYWICFVFWLFWVASSRSGRVSSGAHQTTSSREIRAWSRLYSWPTLALFTVMLLGIGGEGPKWLDPTTLGLDEFGLLIGVSLAFISLTPASLEFIEPYPIRHPQQLVHATKKPFNNGLTLVIYVLLIGIMTGKLFNLYSTCALTCSPYPIALPWVLIALVGSYFHGTFHRLMQDQPKNSYLLRLQLSLFVAMLFCLYLSVYYSPLT